MDRPNSSTTGKDKCTKALGSLAHMYLKGANDKRLSILIKTFVVSFVQFAVLESKSNNEQGSEGVRSFKSGYERNYVSSKQVVRYGHYILSTHGLKGITELE